MQKGAQWVSAMRTGVPGTLSRVLTLGVTLKLFIDCIRCNHLPSVHEERNGSSMDAARVVSEGDASVTLTKLKVFDEGTYICTVSLGPFHAQQIIQLRINRKFQSNLSIQKKKKIHGMSFKSSSVALCFRTATRFTLRGEVGSEVELTSDTELPLHEILSTGCSGL